LALLASKKISYGEIRQLENLIPTREAILCATMASPLFNIAEVTRPPEKAQRGAIIPQRETIVKTCGI
jgi:hypothetical protein